MKFEAGERHFYGCGDCVDVDGRTRQFGIMDVKMCVNANVDMHAPVRLYVETSKTRSHDETFTSMLVKLGVMLH
jgi:hypothetical protein